LNVRTKVAYSNGFGRNASCGSDRSYAETFEFLRFAHLLFEATTLALGALSARDVDGE
jgi:hypothetical protein